MATRDEQRTPRQTMTHAISPRLTLMVVCRPTMPRQLPDLDGRKRPQQRVTFPPTGAPPRHWTATPQPCQGIPQQQLTDSAQPSQQMEDVATVRQRLTIVCQQRPQRPRLASRGHRKVLRRATEVAPTDAQHQHSTETPPPAPCRGIQQPPPATSAPANPLMEVAAMTHQRLTTVCPRRRPQLPLMRPALQKPLSRVAKRPQRPTNERRVAATDKR